MPLPPKKTGAGRDLDGDGDIDLADDPARDLDRDGRIDAEDREQLDLDNDQDIDAADRELKAKSGGGDRIAPVTPPTPPGMRLRTGRFQSDH